MEPKPLKGLMKFMLTPGFAAAVARVGWLISDSRCRCKPRRPTYPTLRIDLKNISRSKVKFQLHASGFLKFLVCVVTRRGMAAAPPAPGLSAKPLATKAFGWNGGFPPRKMESLKPRPVIKRPAPARRTVIGGIR